MKTTLLVIGMLLVSGCAGQQARPAEDVAKLDAELAAFCAGPEGPGDHVCEQRAKEDPAALEELCMTVAERAYEAAAGHEMSSLGDAPVPDAAYEDAYARCTEGR